MPEIPVITKPIHPSLPMYHATGELATWIESLNIPDKSDVKMSISIDIEHDRDKEKEADHGWAIWKNGKGVNYWIFYDGKIYTKWFSHDQGRILYVPKEEIEVTPL